MANGDIAAWLQQSQWVIQGTVERTNAATLKAVPVSEHTSVVKVDAILHGTSQLADQRGREVTLYSERPEGLKPGQQAIFFTRSWLYGESLAVVEVGRLSGAATAVREQITAASQGIDDRRLGDRIARAELVIVGDVIDTKPRTADRREIVTEHDPDWHEADVHVQSPEKGPVQANQVVTILFANSGDEMWIDSPKFRKGQEGIWILQRDQKEKGWPVLRVPGLTALDPLDFQSKEKLALIQRLIRPR
jgi:hypothetical protein